MTATASADKAVIDSVIAKDAEVAMLSQDAYNSVMADTKKYTKQDVDVNCNPVGEPYVDIEAQTSDEQTAYGMLIVGSLVNNKENILFIFSFFSFFVIIIFRIV